MRNRFRRIAAAVILLTVLTVFSGAWSEEISPDLILRGEYGAPLKLSVTEPVYNKLAQFGEERLDSLNRLVKHLGISVSADGSVTETAVLADGDPVFSFTETETDSGIRTVYSFEPEKVYGPATDDVQAGDPDFTGYLNEQFFFLNRMLDDLYPMFGKIPETYPDFSKQGAENLSYRGYGKAVRRVTVRFADDYVKEHFPAALADLTETEESRRFIEGLFFSGVQKIVLLYTEEGQVLRINYDGILGQSEDSMRKVSLVWRCLRADGQKKDNVTLKSPAIKGYDRYNMTYVRESDRIDPARHTLIWDFQLDLKAGDVKKKIVFNADLVCENSELTGKAQYSDKADGLEKKVLLTPSLKKENDAEYTGTLEITKYSGKIITSSITAAVSAAPGPSLKAPETSSAQIPEPGSEQALADETHLQQMTESLLIRRLLTLPQSDLEFFSKDIPEDVWNAITESLK